MDYKAVVWLNGEYFGEYEGGETPFSFDVTEKLKLNAENLLAVKVINPAGSNIDGLNIVNIPSKNKSVTKSAGRSLNSGGIWYEVWVVSLPGVYLENELLTGDINSGRLSASLNIKNTLAFSVKATLQLNIYEKTGGC